MVGHDRSDTSAIVTGEPFLPGSQRRSRGQRHGGRSRGCSDISSNARFTVQEDGTISTAGGEHVLVRDTAPAPTMTELSSTAPLGPTETEIPETGAATLLEALGT